MAEDEALVFDFVHEVLRNKGVSDATYERTVKRLGERGLMDLMGLVGYFVTICMVMNVAHAPAPEDPSVTPMTSYPL
jgi:4-carboxymuconolactone decarboxylase